ncbi:MAG: glycoside hydrolase N-terminal domain-containing protein [Lentisphaeria bacterium]|nr:glycoside hydrolase N-terminal domain-containing protein [Lentisphaeria bacterium]
MKTIWKWDFPLQTIHQGIPMGNGLLGATLWGEDRTLLMTLGCASLWDHRGGMSWTPEQNFKTIRKALDEKDSEGIKKLFATKLQDENLRRPTLIPLGRIRITLAGNSRLLRSELHMETGVIRILFDTPSGKNEMLFSCDMECIYSFACEGVPQDAQVELLSAFDLPGGREALEKRYFEKPEYLAMDGKSAFLQKMPEDPSFALCLKRDKGSFLLHFMRDATSIGSVMAAAETLPSAAQIRGKSSTFWQDILKKIPSVALGDADLEDLYTFGMYKYIIMTNPAGVTPGLQGPWIEDNQLPPWSGDYHFNINAQMCLTPGYKAGLFPNIRKLFDLVLSWKESLRHNAECFAAIPDGYMLPHAVDDRGVCMGGFWTGCVDHACTAWIAMMMYDYCDYTSDREFLRNEVFDFMKGTMRVFQAMMEYRQEDGTLVLPLSISPEYRGSAMDAWGENSSFQLAAIHRLARNLRNASEILEIEPDPFWLEVEEKLPPYTVVEDPLRANGNYREIALWKGVALEESHRHHSHLGAITPFCTLDPEEESVRDLLRFTEYNWVKKGMGQWTGWCMSWASQIHTRLGNPEMAVYLLKTFKYFFTNSSFGSFHDARHPGLTIFHSPKEIMQMDGAMGCVTAIQDLLVCCREGVADFFRGVPEAWAECSFRDFHLPGGFKASGICRHGKDCTLTIRAAGDGILLLKAPLLREITRIPMQKDQTLRLDISDGKITFL